MSYEWRENVSSFLECCLMNRLGFSSNSMSYISLWLSFPPQRDSRARLYTPVSQPLTIGLGLRGTGVPGQPHWSLLSHLKLISLQHCLLHFEDSELWALITSYPSEMTLFSSQGSGCISLICTLFVCSSLPHCSKKLQCWEFAVSCS